MQDTRQQILAHLQRNPGLSAGDLAQQFELSLGAVRHHLAILEKDALIKGKNLRKPIGRPCIVYELSEEGEESFPKQYDRLSAVLLETLKQEQGTTSLRSFLRRVAERIIHQSGLVIKPEASIENRAQSLAQIMDSEGFSLEWEHTDGELRLIQHACPYQSVVSSHPEVCQIDEQLIQTVIGKQAKRVAHRSKGDCACIFSIDTAGDGAIDASPPSTSH